MPVVVPPQGKTDVQYGGRRFNGPTEVTEALAEELVKIGFILCDSPELIEADGDDCYNDFNSGEDY